MDEETTGAVPQEEVLRMVADIVSAYVGFNAVEPTQLPDLIRTVHAALAGSEAPVPAPVEAGQKPAVPVRRSITPDYLICLEDGRKLKMLKRYLRTKYSMTPEQYRAKWGLSADYPMVAPNYSTQRSSFAKKIGLGRRRE